MVTFLLVSAVFLTLCVIGTILYRDKPDAASWFGTITIAILLFCFGIIPGLMSIQKYTYKEISQEKYTVITNKDLVIIQLKTTIDDGWNAKINEFVKFGSYNIVTQFSDSTKFFIKFDKSFYGITLDKFIVWSNPPYTEYFAE